MSRRFLIALGVGVYRDSGITNLPGAPGDADRVRRLFADLGYREVLPDLASVPGREIPHRIETWAHEARLDAEDIVVVYFAGHAEKNSERHHLLCADYEPGRWTTALPSEELARSLVGHAFRHLLVVLDTCYAGAGGGEVAAMAADLASTQPKPVGRWTLTAARSKETAEDNVFVDALEQALMSLGRTPGVEEIVQRINAYFSAHGRRQHATYSTVDNPGTSPFFHAANGGEALDHARIAELHRLDNARFGTSGRGVRDVTDPGDHFTARTTALDELLSWLRSGTHDRRARVVVGDPGSGKTALLGRLLLLTDPSHPARHHLRQQPEPRLAMDVLALHAHADDVFAELSAVLGRPQATDSELQLVLSRRETPLLLIIDGLDESAEAARFARLLRPFTTLPGLRLVIGSRRPLLPELGPGTAVIDLDEPGHLATSDIARYASDVLLDAHDPNSLSPYRGRPEEAAALGEVIAEKARHMFLYAQVTASAVVKGQLTVGTAEPGWKDRLPNDINQAYSTYFSRYGDQRMKVERLLRPLAYARGSGLPRSIVWPALATALSGKECTAEDVFWLLETASEYLVEHPSADGPVYRLFHETVADYLRRSFPDADSHRTITFALLDLVPADRSGHRDWTLAPPYLRRHLATHAAAGTVLDRLLADADFLVHADPDILLSALHDVPAQLGGAIYRASAATHRRLSPQRRRQILAMDAARLDATGLQHTLSRNLKWVTRWATGRQNSLALSTDISGGGSIVSMACTTTSGHAMAVTTGADRTVRAWDLTTGLPAATLEADLADPVACAMVDGRPLAVVVDGAGTLWLWDLVTGTHTESPGDPGPVHAVACGTLRGHPIAVTGGEDGTLLVRDLVTLEHSVLNARRGRITAVACRTIGDRPTAAAIGGDDMIQVWDLTDGTLRLIGPHRRVVDVDLAELDGEPVVVTVGDSTKVWELRTGAVRREMGLGEGWINAVTCTTAAGLPVAVLGDDRGTVRVRDLSSGEVRTTLPGHRSWVSAVGCVDVDGRPFAVTASGDGTLRSWDFTSAATVGFPAPGHTAEITAISGAVLSGRAVLVSVSEDRTARVWDVATGETRVVLDGQDVALNDVATTVLHGRSLAVTGASDGTVGVWDLDTGEARYTLYGHSGLVHLVTCAEVSGKPKAITAGSDRTIRVWDLATGEHIWTLGGHEGAVRTVATSTVRGEPVLLAGGHFGPVRMWSLATGDPLATLTDSSGGGAIATTTIGGVPVAVVNNRRDNSTTLWDLTNPARKKLAAPPAHALAVHAPAGGDPVLVLACPDSTVRIWDLTHDEHRATMRGHVGRIRQVGCSVIKGRTAVVTLGSDDTVRLWDMSTGTELAVFDFPGPVNAVRHFVRNGCLAVAMGADLVVLEQGNE
ncbi:caspase family protein [Amycolatopsis orientalis]|uniref:caspase family protein n=1 Tax=Amycolatopsis orientalis TaxID=31958 RepID=UPI0004192C38|nr:caspase family protein [Amycolatopsis orientalis]